MQKHEVTLKQITFAASTMIIGTSILTKQLYTFMKQEAWIAIVLGFAVSLLIFLIYSSLAKRFPGLSLIEMNDAVFGRIVGKGISALYVFYFFTIACLNVNVMGNFIKGFVLQGTPMVLILFLFVFVCSWAASKGPQNLMKYNVLLTVVSIVALVLNTTLLLPNIDFKNLMPILSLKPVNYAVGVHSITIVPLCDPFFILMFLPYVKDANGFGKALMKGLTIGVALFLLIVIRDTSVLGSGLENYNMPSFISIRMIDVGDILTRIDIVFIFIIIMLIFYKVALMFFITLSGLQRLLKTGSEKIYVKILGALLIIYAITVFRSASEHAQWLVSGAGHLTHMFIVFVLPLVTLIVAAARGMNNRAAATVQGNDFGVTGEGAGQI